jgi:hypothetical protein
MFRRLARLPRYDKNIVGNATTVCAESAHRTRLDNYTSYEAAKRGVVKFLPDMVDKVWYG